MKLKDKIALITGAGSGIGKEISKLFAEEGATVILTGRHISKLDDVKKEIEDSKGKAESIEMEITDRESVKKAFEEGFSKHGKLDILVNSAGIARWASIENVTYEDFKEQVDINLIGSFNCIKEAVPSMVENKSGCIINIITSTVKNTKANRVAYAASKYGQAGLSNAAHEDLKDKGIRVVAIYPGKTDTPIHEIPENDPARKEMLDPKDVAKLVLEAVTTEKDIKELSI